MAWFEDIAIGARWVSPAYLLTEEAIIAFARQFDPQPFHVDPVAACTGPFGGLVASGWHTVSLWMKHYIAMRDQQLRPPDDPGFGPSPGFVDLRWPVPVRPGDSLTFGGAVIEKTNFGRRPDWGLIRHSAEGLNQRGETVLSFIGQGLAKRRNPLTGA